MSWDAYYLKVCDAIAENSKCLSRKIGAIIVRDKSIISTGYNGPPRGVLPCNFRHLYDDKLSKEYQKVLGYYPNTPVERCPRQILGFKSGDGLDWCVAGHAERNALINAARHGIETKGAKMYMNCPTPCTPCLVEIINAGIEEIVVIHEHYYDVGAKYLLKQSGLKWRGYELPLDMSLV